MNQMIPFRAAMPEEPTLHAHLPAHLASEQQELLEVLEQVQAIRRQADGLFGPIGLDALITPVPLLGAAYSGFTGLRLVGCAGRAHCSASTRITGGVLVVADVIIGAVIGLGDIVDVLFRSHAIYADMIEGEIRSKLVAIGSMQATGAHQGYLSPDDLNRLEDKLYRGGKSKQASRIRLFVTLGILGLILYSCAG